MLEICKGSSLEGLEVFNLGEFCVEIAVSDVKEEKSGTVDRPDFIEKHHGSRPPYLPINCFQYSEGQWNALQKSDEMIKPKMEANARIRSSGDFETLAGCMTKLGYYYVPRALRNVQGQNCGPETSSNRR